MTDYAKLPVPGDWPVGWVWFARSRDVGRSPVKRRYFNEEIVAYRTLDGGVVAMAARCWHMGADLSGGRVDGDCLQCPFHGWKFGANGQCQSVPAGEVPPAARQRVYATSERAGEIFIFNGVTPSHELPFFDDMSPDDLLASPSFEFGINCPWWLVGTNGFDIQHFRGAHDRVLVGEPVVTMPDKSAMRIVATFEVVGRSPGDRLTRAVSGRFVTMDVTVWAGCLAFVQARFAQTPGGRERTTSFGMVEITPDESNDNRRTNRPGATVRVTIFVRRCHSLFGRLLDYVDVRVRRHFIRAFLKPDVKLLDGATCSPDRLIPADKTMADYINWLALITPRVPKEEGP